MKRIFFFIAIMAALLSCERDDKFSTAGGLRLTLPADTLKMDTVFARTPSATYTFWVFNHNNDGIRLSSVRLARRNQSGYRVNVDGSYLDNSNGSQVNDLGGRRKDSLLVFVELTAPDPHQLEPQLVEDHLVFTLENGAEQRILLRAWAWDAERIGSMTLTRDTVIESQRPIIVMDSLNVAQGVTLTLRNTTLYFHDQAGMTVAGTLKTENCTLRGDRLDHMFDYLPYDRVSGQWGGVRFLQSSVDNELTLTEIRNATEAVVCDSAAIDIERPRLVMRHCVVHNAKGRGIETVNTYLILDHCQLSNTLGHCLAIHGGVAQIDHCTLAQFYPFSADRGAALYFSNSWLGYGLPLMLTCENTIITGYADDVVMGEAVEDETVPFSYVFSRSLMRTPKVEDESLAESFTDIIWETPKDSIQGKQHFRTVDEDNLVYDFRLDSLSTAQGMGCY